MFLTGFTTVGPTSRTLLALLANFIKSYLLNIHSHKFSFQVLSRSQFFFFKEHLLKRNKNNYVNRAVGHGQKTKEVYKKASKCNGCPVSGSTAHA